MSDETLQGIHDAIRAHLEDRNGEATVVGDWFVAYSCMRSDAEMPGGIGHLIGYAVNSDGAPHSSVGIARLGLAEMETNLIMEAHCCCPPKESGEG